MTIWTFKGNPNGNLTASQGDTGFDVLSGPPNNYFICQGGSVWSANNFSGGPSGAWGGVVGSTNVTSSSGGGFTQGAYTPAIQFLDGYGFDPTAYISTAKIAPSPYTTTELIQAKFQGANDLIAATDDASQGVLNKAVLNNIIQNVTTEINGYLSTCYPIPLVQTGTICVLKVTSVASVNTVAGVVQSVQVLNPGNYASPPGTDQFPTYLRYLDPLANEECFGIGWQDCFNCQKGTGLELTVTYAATPYSDESGQTLNAQAVVGTPVIVSGGSGYNCDDLIVLIGGQSFVPAKIREAALSLICYDLLQRRLTPNEQNLYAMNNRKWRGDGKHDGLLTKIGDGDAPLDGTYKRFYSAGQSWNNKSVLFDANSL